MGVNQWGPSTYSNGDPYDGADLMKLLNPGYEENTDYICNSSVSTIYDENYENPQKVCGDGSSGNYTTAKVNNSLYWNAGSGLCYSDGDYDKIECNFTSTGLNDNNSKNMIDDHVWYLGSIDNESASGNNLWDGRVKANFLYNFERSNNSSKQCTTDNKYCSDTVYRNNTWNGKVGIMYPSDWAYATGGGTEGRNSCLSKTMGFLYSNSIKSWSNTYTECLTDDWLYLDSAHFWTLSSRARTTNSYDIFTIRSDGFVATYSGNSLISNVRPTVYLKSNVTIASGSGSNGDPFVLSY